MLFLILPINKNVAMLNRNKVAMLNRDVYLNLIIYKIKEMRLTTYKCTIYILVEAFHTAD